MFLEIGALGLIGLAWYRASKKGQFGPERQEMYNEALEHLTDPAKLKKLADAFDAEGLHVQAVILRKRAELRGASPEVKAQRNAIFEKGMKSIKVDSILKLAQVFEDMTATGAAFELRKHAEEVRAGLYPPKQEEKPANGTVIDMKEEKEDEKEHETETSSTQ